MCTYSTYRCKISQKVKTSQHWLVVSQVTLRETFSWVKIQHLSVHPRQRSLRVNFLSLCTKSPDIISSVTFTPVMTMWKAQRRLRRALQNALRQCRVIHTPFGEIGLEKLHCTPLYHVEGLPDGPAELWSGNCCSMELTFFFFFYRNYSIL